MEWWCEGFEGSYVLAPRRESGRKLADGEGEGDPVELVGGGAIDDGAAGC